MRKKEAALSPLREILPLVLQKRGQFHQDPLASLHQRWPEVVGPFLATKSSPLKIYKERLLIGVLSPVWANEIEFSKLSLLEKIHLELPETEIKELRFQTITFLRRSKGHL